MVGISYLYASFAMFYECQSFVTVTYTLNHHFTILVTNSMHKQAQKMVIYPKIGSLLVVKPGRLVVKPGRLVVQPGRARFPTKKTGTV